MRSYSLDLRKRIVASRKEGKSLKWIVGTFQVSISSAKRYIARAQQTGTAAASQQRFQQPRIRGDYEQKLTAQVERMHDATLEMHVVEWERTTGMKVSRATMWRALKRIGQTRKKDNWSSGTG